MRLWHALAAGLLIALSTWCPVLHAGDVLRLTVRELTYTPPKPATTQPVDLLGVTSKDASQNTATVGQMVISQPLPNSVQGSAERQKLALTIVPSVPFEFCLDEPARELKCTGKASMNGEWVRLELSLSDAQGPEQSRLADSITTHLVLQLGRETMLSGLFRAADSGSDAKLLEICRMVKVERIYPS